MKNTKPRERPFSMKLLNIIKFVSYIVCFVFAILGICLPVASLGTGDLAVDAYLFGSESSLAILLTLIGLAGGTFVASFANSKIFVSVGSGLSLAACAYVIYLLATQVFQPFSTVEELFTIQFAAFAAIIAVVMALLLDFVSMIGVLRKGE